MESDKPNDEYETHLVMTGEGYRVEHRKIEAVPAGASSTIAGILLFCLFFWQLVHWLF